MNEQQKEIWEFCKTSKTAAEISAVFGVTRWYVYQLAKRGYLKNVSEDHSAGRYVAIAEPKKQIQKTAVVHRKWKPQTALLQVPSIWHYAERLK